MKILVFDNYDSFTYNLVHILRELGYGSQLQVHRNNKIDLEDIGLFDKILLSPGPGIPEEAGILKPLIQTYGSHKSILGVCLGHQAIAEVYGYCMYKDAEGKAFYIVNGKSGVAHAYHYVEEEGQLNMTLWRSWTLGSQTEGMVADDELGHLYIGEENKGVWKIDLSDEGAQPALLDASQESNNPNIRYDVEGISLYKGEAESGYLIVSSQGNFSYALFDRQSNAYLGSFSIKAANGIDGVEETDGLDICSLPLGSQYPRGVLIVQDGFNYDGDTLKSQNFKIIDNQQVLDLIESQLKES